MWRGIHCPVLGTAESAVHLHPPLSTVSIAWYSFIQPSELRQRGVNKIAQVVKQQPEDFNPGFLS